MALPESQDHWCKEDIEKLLERMDNNLPSNDRHTFRTTQSQMNWGKVAFKDFSGEMCKLKWLEISYNLRKFRTLKELVLEAKEDAKNLSKSKRRKKHPDFPKKPLTAYLRFFREKRAQYSQMHPKLSNQELTKLLSEEYRELPEQTKLKYSQDFEKEKQEFEEKLARFREDHPDLVQNSKKSDVPKRGPSKAQKKFQGNVKEVKSSPENCFSKQMKFHGEPQKPPMHGYQKFYQDLWLSRELQAMPLRERMVEIGRRWQRIPQSQKERYKKQAEELQKQYKVDLDHWLKSLSPEEYAEYREATYAKRRNMSMRGGPDPKIRRMDPQSPSARSPQEGLGEEQGLRAPETESPESVGGISHASPRSEENKEDGEEEEGRNSSDSSSEDEDEDWEAEGSESSSSSSGDHSDSDSN
ncbi:upstream-binding factor 1-like protein 1 [Diceros bicornis minor]|uniref:upstream-binding factor 1-like protein 1 n=1 Tax=Diceros bicornis minor TaxID=77932 RepID=UPI0026F2F3EA|nr:upstream-binding factor 1-like protein 1 [Diceros bicornis minor]